VIHRTVVEMFKEYSQRLDFSYTDSLRDRLASLKEAVISNHILPNRLHDQSAFDSVEMLDVSERPDGPRGQPYSSLYPVKKGVKA
jgi:hypothetical protein